METMETGIIKQDPLPTEALPDTGSVVVMNEEQGSGEGLEQAASAEESTPEEELRGGETLPEDIAEVIALQQTLVSMQLATLKDAKKRHAKLKAKVEGANKTDNGPKLSGIVDPTRDEVVLVSLLDDRGALRRLSQVDQFIDLMKNTSLDTSSNKNACDRSTLIAVLRRSDENIWDQFILLGGFDIIKVWLNEVVVKEDHESCQLILKLLVEAPPVDQAHIKKSAIGKEVSKCRKFGVNADGDTDKASPQELATKELADGITTIWRLMLRGATNLPKVALPAASLSANSKNGSSLANKKNDVFDSVLSGGSSAPSKQQGRQGSMLRQTSAQRAAAARELREERLAQRKGFRKGGSLLQTVNQHGTATLSAGNAMKRGLDEDPISKQEKLRKLRVDKKLSFRTRVFDDVVYTKPDTPEAADESHGFGESYSSSSSSSSPTKRKTQDSSDDLDENVQNHMEDDNVQEEDNAFERLERLDSIGDENDLGGFGEGSSRRGGGGDSNNSFSPSSRSKSRRLKWGDEVEGKTLEYVKVFESTIANEGEETGEENENENGDHVEVVDENSTALAHQGHKDRTKLEHEKERQLMKEARVLEKMEVRQEAWSSITNMMNNLNETLKNKMKEEAPNSTSTEEEDDSISLSDRITASIGQPYVRVQVSKEAPLLIGGEELKSMEVELQDHRNAQLMEVFSSVNGDQEFVGNEAEDIEASKNKKSSMIPLHNMADVFRLLRPNLEELEDGSFDIEGNKKLGSLKNEAVLSKARQIIQDLLPEQLVEMKKCFPENLFPELWKVEEELPAAFRDLSMEMISYLATNQDVVHSLLDEATGEIDPVKLQRVVEEREGKTPSSVSNAATASRQYELQHGHAINRQEMYRNQQQLNQNHSHNRQLGSGNTQHAGQMGGPRGAGGGYNNAGYGVGRGNGNMPVGAGGGGGGAPRVAAVRVEFKRGRQEMFRVDDEALAVKCASFSGPYHIWVERNPGEDVGRVVHQMGANTAGDTSSMDRVIRIASEKDVLGFSKKDAAERATIEYANQKVRQFRLPMTISDAEWQFDKKKLTIYYDASIRVDFRDFVKDVGQHFNTYLWMSRSDGKAPPPPPDQLNVGFGESYDTTSDPSGGKGKGYGKGGKGRW